MTTKRLVSRSLEEISKYLDITGKEPFKVIAFRNAARAIDALDVEITELVEKGELQKTRGIGKAIGPIVEELVGTGRSSYLEELRAQYPPGIFELMKVAGLGVKKIGLLYEKLGISTLEELEAAARDGKIASLPGFGAKTATKILEGVEAARERADRFLLPAGLEVGEALLGRILELEPVAAAGLAGAVRRRLEIVSGVDLVVATDSPKEALLAIASLDLLERSQLVEHSLLTAYGRNEMPVEVRLIAPDCFGAALLVRTGSETFVESVAAAALRKGFDLTAAGLTADGNPVVTRSEEDLFDVLGMRYVEPELREAESESLWKRPPRLVSRSDLRGAFHVHTTYSDGRSTLYEILDAATDREFAYIGISDHSKTAAYAGGLTEERMEEQRQELEKHRNAFASLKIFRGTEADILGDGSIDYDDATLATLDFVIASVHSRFKTPKDEMTRRIVIALGNPFVTFLGHMTGRLLLSRDGYSVEYDAIFEAAAENGVMIEINGNPHRLDLDWRLVRRALDRGVLFSINPDAHSTENLDHLLSGVWAARKGGLAAEHLFNTRGVEEVDEYLRSRRKRAMKMRGIGRRE